MSSKNYLQEGSIMKRVVCGLVMVSLVVLGAAYVAQAITPEQAKATVEKAIAYWKANGKDKAVTEFHNPNSQFRNGDLYVGAVRFDGHVLVNGGNPKLAGLNLLEQKDPNGKYFIKEDIEVAKKGGGWVEYSWINPATKKVQPRKVFVQKVPGEDIFISCGIFQ
jgi:cytochrome c